ncbi:glycosyltransferase [Altericista sp. CCNU0014]|uniref:glycosyltransferase n=1 Tax=Altericista sp. CCNU0014 TaxID=3082949 RepID=UPI00384C0B4D
MNILMITVRADPGGGPEHVYQLSKALLETCSENVSLYIASPEDYPYCKKYRDLVGIRQVVIVPHRKFKALKFLNLIKFIRSNKIDIIHSHGKGAGIYSRLLSTFTQVPCVHSFHGVHIGEYNFLQKNIYLTLERILSIFTSQVIATSKSEFEIFSTLKLCKESKISTIYNGVQIDEKANSYHKSTVNSTQIISMVRFTYQKNVEMQIKIAKSLSEKELANNVTFLILGEGETKKQFIEDLYNEKLQDYFKLEDFVSNRYDLLENSLCYLSTSRWEGMPLSLIEAMACGLPIIATAVPGNVDLVIHNETGFLFDQDSPEEAAEYIKLLIQNQELHASMSAKSRETAINLFSSKQMAKRMYSLYSKLIFDA